MNLDDFKPMPVARWGGAVDYQDPTKVIPGCALVAQNVRFLMDEVLTRFGTVDTMKSLQPYAEVTGIDVLNVLGVINPGQVPVVFADDGSLLQEFPPGSGILTPLTPPVPMPIDARMGTSQAFNNLYMAFSDGVKGLIPPLVLNGRSKLLGPVGQNVIGALWNSSVTYQVGDLVRTLDARWWRCTASAAGPGSSTGPQWPQFNGFFLTGNRWQPSTVQDGVAGGSVWEEWTPQCTSILPAPSWDASNPQVVHNVGGGTLPDASDVYVKLSFVIAQTGESPRSPAWVEPTQGPNDSLLFNIGGPAFFGGPRIPRWIAEINLQPNFFYPVMLNIWAAIVNHGAAAPADNAYILIQNAVDLGTIITISAPPSPPSIGSVTGAKITFGGAGYGPGHVFATITGGGGSGAVGYGITAPIAGAPGNWRVVGYVPVNAGAGYTSVPTITFDFPPPSNLLRAQAAGIALLTSILLPNPPSPYPAGATIQSLNQQAPGQFLGSTGSRWLMVLRKDSNRSLYPVDPNSPFQVSIQGQVIVNIISISRDGQGRVSATVSDVTEFAAGENITVQNCTGDPSFNGSFNLTSVQQTFSPEGILKWTDPIDQSVSNDATGTVTLPAGPPPIAFLPPGGPFDLQDIAAFTVVDGDQAGPFFYISGAQPEVPVVTSITSIQGSVSIEVPIVSLIRFDGGLVQAKVNDITGFEPQLVVTVANTPTAPGFQGDFQLIAVQPTTGKAGVLTWISPQTDAGSNGAEGTISVVSGVLNQAEATVENAAGLAAGQPILISGANQFDALTTIAIVLGNVVTFPSNAQGSSNGGTMAVQQNLPTTAPAVQQTILSISRDFVGNVVASVEDTGGYTPGQLILVNNQGTFNGLFELYGVTIGQDGFSGTLNWVQAGVPPETEAGGLITSCPDILINYDDTLLIGEADNEVTSQLTNQPPPNAADVYFVPSLQRFVYTTGIDSIFYFSDQDDPANLDSVGSRFSVDDNSMSLAVCVREARTGEVIALKTNGGYAVIASDLPPSQWSNPNRWKEHGPPCAAAVGKGKDFLVFPSFATTAGAYRYANGELDWLSIEYQKTWDRVNKKALNTIWTLVDEDTNEIQFGVPLDDATTPSHILVGSYLSGWGEQEVLNRYGKLITARSALKWSIRLIATRTGAVVQRTLPNPPDPRIATHQTVYGPSGNSPTNLYAVEKFARVGATGIVTATLAPTPDIVGNTSEVIVNCPSGESFNGTFDVLSMDQNPSQSWTVTWSQPGPDETQFGGTFATTIPSVRVIMQDPSRLDDNGQGIDSKYRPAFANAGGTLALMRWGGYRAQIAGSGDVNITPFSDDANDQFDTVTINLDSANPVRLEEGLRVPDSEYLTLEVSNGAVPGAGFILQEMILYANPIFAGRRVPNKAPTVVPAGRIILMSPNGKFWLLTTTPTGRLQVLPSVGPATPQIVIEDQVTGLFYLLAINNERVLMNSVPVPGPGFASFTVSGPKVVILEMNNRVLEPVVLV